MRAVIQRVSRADVKVNGETVGEIGPGLLVLLGIGREDGEADVASLAEKSAGLRIFPDGEGRMNRSLRDIGGQALVISQFTLYGDARRGKRPSFIDAAPPDRADALYRKFAEKLRALGVSKVETGRFQAMMDVTLTNAGPVTILLDSRKLF
jgi:D-tyrosyl-tRNA(Tyr) deacylase